MPISATKKHCVGILIKDRWDLTLKSLLSIAYSDQPKDTYDLFIIDNGSSQSTWDNLKQWCASHILPIRNVLRIRNSVSAAKAWNLFLCLTSEYDYRTKMDNDVVLYGTPISIAPKPVKSMSSSDNVFGASNPGAIPNASIILGPGSIRPSVPTKIHTAFLDHLTETQTKLNADMCALVPCRPGVPFMTEHNIAISALWRGRAFLPGGCIQITKKCFDVVGYFDEHLSRMIDTQYSQRALMNKFNISIHSDYRVVHIGFDKPYGGLDILNEEKDFSIQYLDQVPVNADKIETRWTKIIGRISKAAARSKIVNIN